MRRTVLVLAVIASAAGGALVLACGSFSSDEAPPVPVEAAAIDDGASTSDGTSLVDGAADLDAGPSVSDARFAVRCRETSCQDAASPVCCAISGDASFCSADDNCGVDSRAYHCDDNEDCVALGKGFSICCAVTSNDFDAAFNDVALSYCSAMPCQGQSGGLAVEACSLGGSANQCHGGSCMPETTFYPFTFSLCR
jgi:hypothetical protein